MEIGVEQPKKFSNALRTFVYENPILVLIIILFIGACLFVPHFLTPFNLQNFVLQAIDIAIVAIGVTFVVLNGGIDFSSTAILSLGSVFGAYVMAKSPLAGTPWGIPVGILSMVAVGGLVGAVNGLSVVFLKMPSFIATLASMMVANGLAVYFASVVSETAAINGLPSAFFVVAGDKGNLLIPILLTVACSAVTYWLLSSTIFGRHVYATGTNPKTSFISGVPVKKTIFMLMLISGLFAGVEAIYATARNQSGLPSLGDKVFIDIIAAIIVGGTSIMGGSGGIKQTLYGVIFITLLNNVVNLLGVDWTIISLLKGVLVLVAAVIDVVTRRLELMRKW
ncbi:MAG TPA: ABC transporter permease [Anaerolineaceae bacterium]|jgi:ribose transport system permease protein